ncbi:MAG: NF038130 family PEP-CTERM protein, partial [Planctomycetota bacterium]
MLRSFLLFSLAAVLAPSVTRADFVTSGSVTRFCSDGINTFADGDGGMSCSDSLSTILSGNAVFPGGNVQLAGGGSTLTGDFAANGIVTFVGLSDADWFANPVAPTFGAADFANTWYAGLMSAHGAQVQTNAGTNVDADIFDQLVNDGVFTRLSMPNVAYVNNSGGTVTFGLAGDQDGGNLPGTLLTDTTVSAVVNV